MHYIVAEPGIFELHEIPINWGLLVRDGNELQVVQSPVEQTILESRAISFLERIARASVNREIRKKYGLTSLS